MAGTIEVVFSRKICNALNLIKNKNKPWWPASFLQYVRSSQHFNEQTRGFLYFHFASLFNKSSLEQMNNISQDSHNSQQRISKFSYVHKNLLLHFFRHMDPSLSTSIREKFSQIGKKKILIWYWSEDSEAVL